VLSSLGDLLQIFERIHLASSTKHYENKCKNNIEMARRHRIDTHSHFLPEFYREALETNGHKNPDGMPAVPVNPNNILNKRAMLMASSNGPKPPT
jgi:hypothetical protein